jgi:VWFA-related protein
MRPGVSFGTKNHFYGGKWWLAALLVFCGTHMIAGAQENAAPPAQNPPAGNANETAAQSASQTSTDTETELSTKDTGTTFKLHVNLVQVPVVVRDSKGSFVPGLKREDFQLFDQGKLQTIMTFGVETPQTRRERAEAAAKTQLGEVAGNAGPEKITLPERFIALVFDDIHLNLSDATVVRNSARSFIESLAPTDRMAIFGTSEQVKQEFTGDKGALERVLPRILPRPKVGQINETTNCPYVNHYMADQYENRGEQRVLDVVTWDTLQCRFAGDRHMLEQARLIADTALRQALIAGDTDNEYTYRALEDVIRRLKGMPGERVLVLASPGFLLSSLFEEEMGIIELANHANIVINTLDARGLYTPDIMGDISEHRSSDTLETAGPKAQYREREQAENEFVLANFAEGTGGTFFRSSNDLVGGLKRAGEAPEILYVLGFSPQNQRMDGKFHVIKVTLTKKQKYRIQARRGYYAPKKLNDPQQQAKQEIAEAVFSQEEIHELPLELQTQYFKSSDAKGHLQVVSRIDIKSLQFRKAEGRNSDDLTVATVLFDENGNSVLGVEKLLEMRLSDETYAKMSKTPLVVTTSLDVKPGRYMIRQVVRESEGAQMAARNQTVFIPF